MRTGGSLSAGVLIVVLIGVFGATAAGRITAPPASRGVADALVAAVLIATSLATVTLAGNQPAYD